MDDTVTPMKRLASIWNVVGLPSTGLFAVSDFFSPVKGWIILLAFGALMLSLFVAMGLRCFYSNNQPDWWKNSWWYKFTTKERELQWWWTGKTFWGFHGVWVPLALALACIVSGSASYAKQQEGGVLAGQFYFVKTLQKMAKVIEEREKDPCAKLADLNKACDGETFLSAVEEGNTRIVELALQGNVPVQTAKSKGRRLPVMLALNEHNPGQVLDLLVNHKVDINQPFKNSGFNGHEETFLGEAIERGNEPLVAALIKNKVDIHRPIDTLVMANGTQFIYALPAAVGTAKIEIAEKLIDAGADPKLGDYAAYREAHAALKHPRNAGNRPALERIQERTAPPKSQAQRVKDELLLGDIMQELSDVGSKSIMTSPYLPEKKRYEQRYAELQQERTALEKKLGISRRK